MTIDELRVVGSKLRGMRNERHLKQADVADDPKADGLSVGTLQAIEGAWHEVRDANVEKYARFFGTTRERLLQEDKPKALTASDSRLKDLNDEHLDIARGYMRARKRVRAAIEFLLSDPPHEQFATLLETLAKVPPEQLVQLDAWLLTDPSIMQLLERIRIRCLTDRSYFELALKNDAIEEKATSALTAQSPKSPKKAIPTVRRLPK